MSTYLLVRMTIDRAKFRQALENGENLKKFFDEPNTLPHLTEEIRQFLIDDLVGYFFDTPMQDLDADDITIIQNGIKKIGKVIVQDYPPIKDVFETLQSNKFLQVNRQSEKTIAELFLHGIKLRLLDQNYINIYWQNFASACAKNLKSKDHNYIFYGVRLETSKPDTSSHENIKKPVSWKIVLPGKVNVEIERYYAKFENEILPFFLYYANSYFGVSIKNFVDLGYALTEDGLDMRNNHIRQQSIANRDKSYTHTGVQSALPFDNSNKFEDLHPFVTHDNNMLASRLADDWVFTQLGSGKTKNMWIHGPQNTGKHFLVHTAVARLRKYFPHLIIKKVTGEEFSKQYLNALKPLMENKSNNQAKPTDQDFLAHNNFVDQWNMADIVIVHHVEGLISKQGTQKKFAQFLGGKTRFIFISESNPKDILAVLHKDLADKAEQFHSESTSLPEYASRKKILQVKAKDELGKTLPDEVAGLIAKHVSATGLYDKILAAISRRGDVSAMKKEDTLELVKDYSKLSISLTLQDIYKWIQMYVDDELPERKNNSVVNMLFAYYARKLTKDAGDVQVQAWMRDEIARFLGVKSEATVAKYEKQARDYASLLAGLDNYIRSKIDDLAWNEELFGPRPSPEIVIEPEGAADESTAKKE